jgi:hypothetical protein
MVASSLPHNVVLNVTPSMASRWLEGNTHNRSINNGHVDRLVREMKAGRWQLSHQGIAFSPSGRLLDGQHRLWAIVMSGVTVPVRVFFNESPQAIETYDGGITRSTSDRMSLGGRFDRDIDHKHLATLRCMVRGLRPVQRLSYGDEADLLARHLDAICFAMKHLTTSERARGVATAITKAVIARAYYSVDQSKLIHFCKVLRTGFAGGSEDESIIMLRDHLVQSEKARNALCVVREQYGKTERALLAFLRGERLVRLYAVTTELFPLPEEMRK